MKSFALGVCLCLLSAVFSARIKPDFARREAEIVGRLLELSKNETFLRLYQDTFLGEPQAREPFACPIIPPSPSVPTSVHELRPGDVKLVAALGDSLTAGRGSSGGIVGLLIDYRGLSWSVGGDGSIEDTRTLANVLRQYNPDLKGFSTGVGGPNSDAAHLNVAVTGDESHELMAQATDLVDKLQSDSSVDFNNDWKVITVFIGGNDLCAACTDEAKYSVEKYKENLQETLDYLHSNVPRAFVNLVEVLNIEIAKDLAEGLVCQAIHGFLCTCATNPSSPEAEQQLVELKNQYQGAARDLASSGRYDTKDDFTVVLQPFYRDTYLPYKPDGTIDYSYFASDCFHHSKKGQEATGGALWNNMVEPVGEKRLNWMPEEPLECPTEDSPYLYTAKNSPSMKVVGSQ
ncbi:phospholipase B1, membrane-associated [Aplysia californica]|uniref:Phospholipase B1, membrane-associated n=1 Tax=Aplysia californica TaxID=6500 RepID=A0ABM1W166_APLCA|nr:phospholipase B1, membrane-associated [Aplysia californica]